MLYVFKIYGLKICLEKGKLNFPQLFFEGVSYDETSKKYLTQIEDGNGQLKFLFVYFFRLQKFFPLNCFQRKLNEQSHKFSLLHGIKHVIGAFDSVEDVGIFEKRQKKKILFFNKVGKKFFVFFSFLLFTAARAYDQQLLVWFSEDPQINEFLNFPKNEKTTTIEVKENHKKIFVKGIFFSCFCCRKNKKKKIYQKKILKVEYIFHKNGINGLRIQ